MGPPIPGPTTALAGGPEGPLYLDTYEQVATDDSGSKTEVSDLVENHAERLDRYARGHARALAQADWIAANVDHDPSGSGPRLANCGTWLEFRELYTLGEIKCTAARFCDQPKLCPLCAARRAGRTIRRYAERIDQVLGASSNLRPFLVTLTMKNEEDLLHVLDHLKDSLARMRKRRTHAQAGKINSVFGHFDGVLGGVEVKRGKGSGAWHPHAHMLVLSTADLARQDYSRRISQEWHDLTGTSFITDVRCCHNEQDPVDALLEVVKYPLKFGENDLGDAWHFHQLTKGRRFLFSLGNLYGVKVDLLDETPEDLPYIERAYSFAWEDSKPRYRVREIRRYTPGVPATV